MVNKHVRPSLNYDHCIVCSVVNIWGRVFLADLVRLFIGKCLVIRSSDVWKACTKK